MTFPATRHEDGRDATKEVCIAWELLSYIDVAWSTCEALLGSGASLTFICPVTVKRLQLKARRLCRECIDTAAC